MSNRTPGRPPAQPPTAADPEPIASRKRKEGAHPFLASPDLLAASTPSGRAVWTVGPDQIPEHLFRHLLSAYLAGASSFAVTERPRLSPRTREVVREFCRRTQQPEVVHDDGRRIVLEERSARAADPPGARLDHLGRQVVAFHREAVGSWERLPFGGDDLWDRLDDEIDREAWYLERCELLGAVDNDRRPAPATWTVIRSLERIADHAVTLGEVGPRLSDPAADRAHLRRLCQFHAQAMEHLEAVLRARDGSQANELLDVGEALLAGGRALAEQLLPSVGEGSVPPAHAAAVARALEAISRTIAYSQDIAQAGLDLSVQIDPRRSSPVAVAALGTA